MGLDETSCPSRRFRRRPWSSPRRSSSRPRSVGHHLSVVGRRQQVPTGPKVRPDAAERGQESVRPPDRRDAFHRRLALPGRLMRGLGPVVQARRPAILHRRHELAVRHLVAGERVGDDHPGHLPQAREQAAEELPCGHRVSARPDHNVEHLAVLVDRAPQLPLCAVDLDEHRIEVPCVARPPTTTPQLVRVPLPEPVTPGPDRLKGHLDTTVEHQPPARHGSSTGPGATAKRNG